MVVKRKLSCGTNGFEFSNIPKAPRSNRRKVLSKREDDVECQIRAIDLLASLAGKLLEETESSSASTYGSEGDNRNLMCGKGDVYINKICKSELFPSLENDCVSDQTPVPDSKSGLLTDVSFGLKDPSQSDGYVKLLSGVDRVVSRDDDDDDENYCKYYKYSDKIKSYRYLNRVGNRRMKKPVMAKYGRAFPKSKCFEDARTDGCLRAFNRKRNLCNGYKPWKRRLVVSSDGGLSSESVCNSPVKAESAIGLHSKDSRVKLSIKSFRIPELFIEVPETATVGSLKRTVMEAVTSLLGDGIHIGVLVQGKKVRDDNNTLSQTGLSCIENLGNLGFTLEPGPDKKPLSVKKPVVSVATDSSHLSERSSASPALDSGITLALEDADPGNCVENKHELVTYKSDDDQQLSSDSKAMVPVSALEPEEEALAIVAFNEKPKRTEASQRRTRRPFSVTEVEALVQAVEELGTGRWRDVKLCSFENANHRTYVDLKDKWKTLVHTASISPQQRRGQPVPQELLDRVLAAHKYWSPNQPKQNGKHQGAAAATMVVG